MTPQLYGHETQKMVNSWRSAYFRQAHADYEMFLPLENTRGISLCHRLHYLQMMTEKLAKGFNTPPTAKKEHAHTHAAFLKFLKTLKLQPEFRQVRGNMSNDQFDSYLKGLYALADRVQNLAPDLAKEKPNPEYPWRMPTGTIVAPAEFGFPDLDLNAKDPHLIKLLELINTCFKIADRE